MSLFSLLYIVSTVASVFSQHSAAPVYFSLIYSGGGAGGFNSSSVIPAIDIALEEIARNDVLPGYNLTYYSAVDSQVRYNIAIHKSE